MDSETVGPLAGWDGPRARASEALRFAQGPYSRGWLGSPSVSRGINSAPPAPASSSCLTAPYRQTHHNQPRGLALFPVSTSSPSPYTHIPRLALIWHQCTVGTLRDGLQGHSEPQAKSPRSGTSRLVSSQHRYLTSSSSSSSSPSLALALHVFLICDIAATTAHPAARSGSKAATGSP
ncbi:hypothetical protein BCV69DRAFT_48252 [Microstroma glucosiphilum]|uniref:Uncharacterized protein n=1 Tax=Pseudomicrostroma glucosiphilum TaxID=1684307 RepID=A0A316U1H0_9BASI|nr:hypothetical protein BCV69DRAFT_48252 [Pseudomicrostroma glucosiphilum]PWN19236.1 hypothetical protein BCV69DRAFT_48252 [Pseudomicrostroma glucosiphilum]